MSDEPQWGQPYTDALQSEVIRLREQLHTCRDDYHRKVIALQAEIAALKRAAGGPKDSVSGDDPMVLPSESRADSQAGLTGPSGSLNPGTEPGRPGEPQR